MDTIAAMEDTYLLLGKWPYKKETDGFPIISTGVWPILLIATVWLAMTHLVLPNWMRQRKAMDLRVLMLVLNSALLAGYLSGLPIALYFNLNSGASFLTCKPDGKAVSPIYVESLLYIGFLYILMKIVECHRSVIAALRKKDSQRSLMNDLFRVNELIITYFGFRIQPIGMSMFYGTLDVLVGIYTALYYVLSSGGEFYQHTRFLKYGVPWIRLMEGLISFYHASSVIGTDCDYPPPLIVFELELATLLCFGSIYNLYRNHIQGKIFEKKLN